MAMIKFTGKVKTMYRVDNSIAYQFIKIPELSRKHCDMENFRSHKKYGMLANSDLFNSVLVGIKKEIFGGDILKLDAIPHGVSVDLSGFLAEVSFNV